MTTSHVDLSQLAIDRETPDRSGTGLRFKHHLVTRYLIPAVLFAGFLGIVAWASRDSLFPPLDVDVAPVLATQDSVRVSGTPLFSAAGWIEPRPTPVRVPGLAPGVVDKLLVVEDQLVTAGEPVAVLIRDDARLVWEMAVADQKLREAELKHANAALAAAETRLAHPVHLRAPLAEAETVLAGIRKLLANLPFELERARSRLRFAQSDYERNLAAQDSVAEREVEEAKTVVETMTAMVEELERRNASLGSELNAVEERRDALNEQLELLIDETRDRDQAVAQVDMADSQLKQATVRVAEAQLQLDRMTVRAPVDGRVLLLVSHPGTRIGGMRDEMSDAVDGSTVVTLYRPEMLQVKVDVRFEDVPQVHPGQPVRINNPAIGEPLTGTVLFVSSEADIQKNTLEVKVAIDSPPTVFKPDMLVDVTFLAAESAESDDADSSTRQWRLYIPQALVQNNNGSPTIWVADRAANVAKRVTVETGDPGPDDTIEIISGLDVSSRVIISSRDQLKEGTRIRIREDAP